MNLKELKDSGFRIAKLAELVDCSVSILYKILHGKRRCGKRLAVDIERVMYGVVSKQELFDMYKKRDL